MIIFKTTGYSFCSPWTNASQEDRTRTRRMPATSLPSLLFFFTTAQLLSGGQAAYLQEPENPGTFQQDSPASKVQYYKPLHSYPPRLNTSSFKTTISTSHRTNLDHPTQCKRIFLQRQRLLQSNLRHACAEKYKVQKKLEDMKKEQMFSSRSSRI